MPPVMKPVFGYLMVIPIHIWKKKSYRYLLPVFKERMDNIVRERKDPGFELEEPRDMISWLVAIALEIEDIPDFETEVLVEHLLFTVST